MLAYKSWLLLCGQNKQIARSKGLGSEDFCSSYIFRFDISFSWSSHVSTRLWFRPITDSVYSTLLFTIEPLFLSFWHSGWIELKNRFRPSLSLTRVQTSTAFMICLEISINWDWVRPHFLPSRHRFCQFGGWKGCASTVAASVCVVPSQTITTTTTSRPFLFMVRLV